jgi:hypothetical protein
MLMFLSPSFKDHAFHEESEWRFVIFNADASGPHVQFRPKDNVLIPYIDFPLLSKTQQFTNDFVREIILGPAPHSELSLNSMRQFIQMKLDLPYQTVRASNVPYRQW